MTQENSREIIERLQDLIRKHRVCYEVWPENLVVNQQIVKVGFALELEGTHEQPESEVQPGCPHCEQVFKDLQRIAEWIMPAEGRPTTYEIQPFDRAIRYSPKRKRRPEVSLKVCLAECRSSARESLSQCQSVMKRSDDYSMRWASRSHRRNAGPFIAHRHRLRHSAAGLSFLKQASNQ